MDKSTSAVEEFSTWLIAAGLYSSKTFTIEDALELAEHTSGLGLKIDGYCPWCKSLSTFLFTTNEKLKARAIKTEEDRFLQYETPHERVEAYLPGVLGELRFTCARGGALHAMVFYVACEAKEHEEEFTVTKVGQMPSQFDLISGDLLRYSKLLDSNDMRELKSAAVCHSSGYHVAAFTYLRRLFERRLGVAHSLASKDASWNEDAYTKTFFMEDKIQMLREHLPTFLVEHRRLYNILSTGVHELAESECADGYEVVRLGITLILDEEIETRQRAAKISAAGKSLQQLQQKYQK